MKTKECGKLVLKHKRNTWMVYGASHNEKTHDLSWATLGYQWVKLCPVSGCVVYYHNQDWRAVYE